MPPGPFTASKAFVEQTPWVHTCFALASQHPHTTKMASASALAGAFTSLGVSANRTAKKTNVVAKKVRARVDDRFSGGGYRREGRRRHPPDPDLRRYASASRGVSSDACRAHFTHAFASNRSVASLRATRIRAGARERQSSSDTVVAPGCNCHTRRRKKGFQPNSPRSATTDHSSTHIPSPPGVLRPLRGALRQARSDGASPHPSLSRPRSPG